MVSSGANVPSRMSPYLTGVSGYIALGDDTNRSPPLPVLCGNHFQYGLVRQCTRTIRKTAALFSSRSTISPRETYTMMPGCDAM